MIPISPDGFFTTRWRPLLQGSAPPIHRLIRHHSTTGVENRRHGILLLAWQRNLRCDHDERRRAWKFSATRCDVPSLPVRPSCGCRHARVRDDFFTTLMTLVAQAL
jgi:hypothetical protein